jgi:hypothetical protein
MYRREKRKEEKSSMGYRSAQWCDNYQAIETHQLWDKHIAGQIGEHM